MFFKALIVNKIMFIVLIFFFLSCCCFVQKHKEISLRGQEPIHIQFDDKVEGVYEVDIHWYPDTRVAPVLTGLAVLKFSKGPENSFLIFSESLHFDKKILEKLKVEFDFENSKGRVLDKISYVNSKLFNKISLVENKQTAEEKTPPFFFEDVNFDGVKELIIVEKQNGQRHRDTFKVYKLEGQNRVQTVYDLTTKEPFKSFDSETQFDLKNQTVTIRSSGGTCILDRTVYKYVKKKYTSGLEPVKLIEFDDSKGKCRKFVYDIHKKNSFYEYILKSSEVFK